MAIATNTATSPMPAAAAAKADLRRAQYLEIRGVVHRKLLTRLNLEELAPAERSRDEAEIRPLVASPISETGTPLSLSQREAIVGGVLDEAFGIGPLQPLRRGNTVSDIL